MRPGTPHRLHAAHHITRTSAAQRLPGRASRPTLVAPCVCRRNVPQAGIGLHEDAGTWRIDGEKMPSHILAPPLAGIEPFCRSLACSLARADVLALRRPRCRRWMRSGPKETRREIIPSGRGPTLQPCLMLALSGEDRPSAGVRLSKLPRTEIRHKLSVPTFFGSDGCAG